MGEPQGMFNLTSTRPCPSEMCTQVLVNPNARKVGGHDAVLGAAVGQIKVRISTIAANLNSEIHDEFEILAYAVPTRVDQWGSTQ